MNTIGMLMAHQAVIEVAWTGMGIEDLQRDQISFIGLLSMTSIERQPDPPAPLASLPAGFSRTPFILKPIRFEHGTGQYLRHRRREQRLQLHGRKLR